MRCPSRILLALVGSLATGLAPLTPLWAADPQPDRAALHFFEEKVRPLLAQHCYKCHGPQKQQSGLRLDSRAALLAGGDQGPAVVPGKPSQSLLIEAVRQTGDLQMPPQDKLPAEAVAALVKWVQLGAPWPTDEVAAIAPASPAGMAQARREHWAFQPLKAPPLPDTSVGAWGRTSIDRFVLASLRAKGLKPSPPAERHMLIRRASFDLTGLPPTPAEVADFEADRSPEAFAKVIDRLLASPRYGERWGRYWLDVARYADNKGYVFFQEENFAWSYTYRDYVIRAFNTDLPYDQFVLQQLAADRLDLGSDKRPLTALGFLTLGGRFMNNEHDTLDDRIDVVTRGLLGLTVTCARCHDHKFDAIPSADYYALYGIFASSVEPAVPPLFEPPPQTDEYKTFEKELTARETKLRDFVNTKQGELLTAARTRAAEYMLAADILRRQPKTDDFMLLADGEDLNPKMILRWQVYLDKSRKRHDPVLAVWNALADLPQHSYPEPAFAEQAFSEQAAARLAELATGEPLNPLALALVQPDLPRSLNDAAQRYGKLLNRVDRHWQEALQQAAAAGRNPPSTLPDPAEEEVRQVLYGPEAPPNLAVNPFGDLELLPDRPSQDTYEKLRKEVENYRATGPGAPPRAMALVDAPTPYEPRVFLRGNPNQLGEAVPRRFLQVLSSSDDRPFQKGSGRLELAQKIVDPRNPLTARVLVNRVWLHHFGSGLVRTPSDFGVRIEPPSHPALLDHLASTLIREGWSLKQLHRRIMLSSVYQQQSADRPDCFAVDPENRLLWKANRRRLDFEALRDSLLAVAGTLDEQVGGPPVKLFDPPYAKRRTVYGFVDRLNLPGLLRTFDFPSPDSSSPQRDTTTVAPQALFLMNHPFLIEESQRLAQRPELAAAGDQREAVERLYQLLFSRLPTEDELRLAHQFFGEDETRNSLVNWQRYAQALLLTNEFVFVD
jgi:mono/diheme cytochrome c family protein